MPAISEKLILIPILIAGIVSSIYAQDCFAPSPSIRPDSKNPSIVPRNLTQTEYNDLKKLIEWLQGIWSGSGEEVSCRGTLSDPLQQISKCTIKAKTCLDHFGNFSLYADIYLPEQRVTRSEKLDLYLTEKTFRSGNNNGAGDVEFVDLSADMITYRQRFVTGNPMQSEMITTIQRAENTFVFIRSFYFMGNLTGKNEWHLAKTK